jgi:fructose 1,6-bisphosphatase
VFINLSRCTDALHTAGLIFHELMHLSFWVHNYNIELEEEIITYAENESYEVVRLVYDLI